MLNGRKLVDRRAFNGRNNGRLKIVAEVSRYLLDRGVLQRWAGLCLQQRCLQLELDMGVKITHTALRNFYCTHNVRYRSVSFTYQQAMKKSRALVLHFSLTLARLISDDKPIVYFDESSFNMWMRGSSTWTLPDMPVKWELN